MDWSKFIKDSPKMKYVKSQNYPSRLELLKVAIDSQIQAMQK